MFSLCSNTILSLLNKPPNLDMLFTVSLLFTWTERLQRNDKTDKANWHSWLQQFLFAIFLALCSL